MAIFKTIGFQQIFNANNTPAGGLDRFGYPIKQLMLQLDTNKLYILDQNNNIIPLSTNYATRTEIQWVKQNIGSMFHYRGWLKDITTVEELIAAKPDAKPGDVYAIGPKAEQYVCTGNKTWQPLGNSVQVLSGMLSTCFLGKGSTIKQLSSYIAISDWNALVGLCSTGVRTALDTIISNTNPQYCTTFNEFINYCYDAGITGAAAFKLAQKNYELIKTLSSDLSTHIASCIISEISGDVINIASSIVTSYAPSKAQFNALSGSYDNFVSKILTRNNDIDKSLSALQIGLDGVNSNLSSIYDTIKF